MRKRMIILSSLLLLTSCQKTNTVITIDGSEPRFGNPINNVERDAVLEASLAALGKTENLTIKYKYSYDNSMLYRTVSQSQIKKVSTNTTTLITTEGLQDNSVLAVTESQSDTDRHGMKMSESASTQVLRKAFRIYDEESETSQIVIGSKTLTKNGNYKHYGTTYAIESRTDDVQSYRWSDTLKDIIVDYLPVDYQSFSKLSFYKEASASSDSKEYKLFSLLQESQEETLTNYLYPTDSEKKIGVTVDTSALLSIQVKVDDSGEKTYTPLNLTYHKVSVPVTDFEFAKNTAVMDEMTWTVSYGTKDDSVTASSDIENSFTWDNIRKEATCLPSLYSYTSTTLSSDYNDTSVQKTALTKSYDFTDYSSSYQQIKGGNYHHYSRTQTFTATALTATTFALRRYLDSSNSTTNQYGTPTVGYVLYRLKDKQELNVDGKCEVKYYGNDSYFFTVTPTTDAGSLYKLTFAIDYPEGLDETPTLSLTFEPSNS